MEGNNASKGGSVATSSAPSTKDIIFRDVPERPDKATSRVEKIGSIFRRKAKEPRRLQATAQVVGVSENGSVANAQVAVDTIARDDFPATVTQVEASLPPDPTSAPEATALPGQPEAAGPTTSDLLSIDAQHAEVGQMNQAAIASLKENPAAPRPAIVIEATPAPALAGEPLPYTPIHVETNVVSDPSALDNIKDSALQSAQDVVQPQPITPNPTPTPHPDGPLMAQVMSAVQPAEGILQPPSTGELAPQAPTAPQNNEQILNMRDVQAVQGVVMENRADREAAAAQAASTATPDAATDSPTTTPLRSEDSQQAKFQEADAANASAWNNQVRDNEAKIPLQADEIIPPPQPRVEAAPPPVVPEPIEAQFEVTNVTTGNVNPAKDPRFGEGTLSTADYADAMLKQMDPAEQAKKKLNIDLTAGPAGEARREKYAADEAARAEAAARMSRSVGMGPPPEVPTYQPTTPDAATPPVSSPGELSSPPEVAALPAGAAEAIDAAVKQSEGTPSQPAVEAAAPLPDAPKTPEEYAATDPEFTPQLEAAAERAKQRIAQLEAEMAKQRSFLDRLTGRAAPTLSQKERQEIHDEEQKAVYAEVATQPNAPELAQQFPKVAEAVQAVTESTAAPEVNIDTAVAEYKQKIAGTNDIYESFVASGAWTRVQAEMAKLQQNREAAGILFSVPDSPQTQAAMKLEGTDQYINEAIAYTKRMNEHDAALAKATTDEERNKINADFAVNSYVGESGQITAAIDALKVQYPGNEAAFDEARARMLREVADRNINGNSEAAIALIKGQNPDLDAALQRKATATPEQPDPAANAPLETLLDQFPSKLAPEDKAKSEATITQVRREVMGIKTPLELEEKMKNTKDPAEKKRLAWLLSFFKFLGKVALGSVAATGAGAAMAATAPVIGLAQASTSSS